MFKFIFSLLLIDPAFSFDVDTETQDIESNCTNCQLCAHKVEKAKYACEECKDGFERVEDKCSAIVDTYYRNVIIAVCGGVLLLFLLLIPYCIVRSKKATASETKGEPTVAEVPEVMEGACREDATASTATVSMKADVKDNNIVQVTNNQEQAHEV